VFVKQYLVMQQHPQGRTLLSGDQLKKMQGANDVIVNVLPEQLDDVLLREFNLTREG
jgi:N-hydroxyarylamine O-acetyltransferase